MRRLLLLTVVLLLAVPAGADAARRYVVSGAGFGHGVGMSQWGAYGFAKKGRSYEEILFHYYRGTKLARVPNAPVRVLLQDGAPEVSFSGAEAAGGRRLDPAQTYRVRRHGPAGVEVRMGSKLVGRAPGALAVTGSGGSFRLGGRAINGVSGGAYRGDLELRPSGAGLMAVNALAMEDYLRGVVPGESPSSWPKHALRAQAVAARSYALATDRGGGAYDQLPDTRSQVYAGIGVEQASTDAAIRDTAGQVLSHGGKIATTYFFSTSGGRTENVENVFYGSPPSPYLRSVEDPFDDSSPRHRWRLTFSQAQIDGKLRGLVKGRFVRLKVIRRGASPRIVRAIVRGTRGTAPINGAQLRARLGLPDAWAYLSAASAKAVRARPTREGRASSWTAQLVTPGPVAGYVAGTIDPRPVAGGAVLERRRGKGWKRMERFLTAANGSYRVAAPVRGRYRVRAGATASPEVRVR
ncbi:MAG: SpoIID/LytB domain-containing protein [Thermoleophilaceae bacterium]